MLLVLIIAIIVIMVVIDVLDIITVIVVVGGKVIIMKGEIVVKTTRNNTLNNRN